MMEPFAAHSASKRVARVCRRWSTRREPLVMLGVRLGAPTPSGPGSAGRWSARRTIGLSILALIIYPSSFYLATAEVDLTSTGDPNPSREPSTAPRMSPVSAPEDAEEIALLVLYGRLPQKRSAITSRVALAHDTTPFLGDRLVGRELWRVRLDDWSLDLPSSPPGRRNGFIRGIDVFLDPQDGRLLKIETQWPPSEPPIAPQPSAESAARQMEGSGEVYVGFPDEPPPISFLEAVDIIQEQGANPLVAKQITGSWVLWSKMGSEPKPVWAITLRGIPSISPHRDVHIDLVNHMRWIVDPVQKKWLMASTTPQPEQLDPARATLERPSVGGVPRPVSEHEQPRDP